MDLHNALKSEELKSGESSGVSFKLIRLQWSKDSAGLSLHASPHAWSTAGFQVTDFLSYLGFARGTCSFLSNQQCFSRSVAESFDFDRFIEMFSKAYSELQAAQSDLTSCGFYLDRPEGWSYFFGGQSSRYYEPYSGGDGHTSGKSPQLLKETEDDNFYFKLTWIEGDEKGWAYHYRPKHLPVSEEISAVFNFLKLKHFDQCPEFEFEECYWKFLEHRSNGDFFDGNAGVAHQYFDAQSEHFSKGIEKLLSSQRILEEFGMGFLPNIDKPEVRLVRNIEKKIKETGTPQSLESTRFDVAISFAGSERAYADKLAELIKKAGFSVFYDSYYPEELWGKDLVITFNRIYSSQSKYCVIFVSGEYNKREWTIFERRSAQERMIKEKGNEYILPIKVEDIELDGLPSTIGYLSINLGIEKIAEKLIKKLKPPKKT